MKSVNLNYVDKNNLLISNYLTQCMKVLFDRQILQVAALFHLYLLSKSCFIAFNIDITCNKKLSSTYFAQFL